jgi:hypothetical protein
MLKITKKREATTTGFERVVWFVIFHNLAVEFYDLRSKSSSLC